MVEVKVLKTPNCSSCAKAMEILAKIKKDMPNLKIKEVNILEHPEEVQKYQIMSSPGIVIDGKLAFTGVPKEADLRKKLAKA